MKARRNVLCNVTTATFQILLVKRQRLHFFYFIVPLILISSCTNSMKEIDAVTGKAQTQEDVGKDVTILYSKKGKTEARLFTHELVRNTTAKPPYTDMKGGLKVEFFDDSTHIKNTLTARYARWYEQAGNILLRDSVKVVNDKGEELKTAELVWNQSIQKFFTEKPVQIQTATQTIFGQGLEANQDFSWYSIHQITGSVRVNKGTLPGT